MPDSMPIYVNNHLFLGRVEEQKQFRAALRDVLNPSVSETLPYVFLLYGDGGMGKTTLARRFLDIATTEPEFESYFQTLVIDWETARNRHTSLQVGREQISPETVFDLFVKRAQEAFNDHPFKEYTRLVQQRIEAEKEATNVVQQGYEQDEILRPIASVGASILAGIVRQALPIGESGEKLAQQLLQTGIEVGADKALALRQRLEARLRNRLKPEQYQLFVYPHEQLAKAIAIGLQQVTRRKPLLLFWDTYEIIDRTDVWVRDIIKQAGSNLLWLITGRNDLVRSRQFGTGYFQGYSNDFPRRLVTYDMPQLAQADVQAYLADEAPERLADEKVIHTIAQATRGIPFAIRVVGEMWQKGVPLEEIVTDIDSATPGKEIINRMTERYLLHLTNEADRQALYALAWARGDARVLRRILQPGGIGGMTFDLDARLQQLRRDYAAVHLDEARLHDEPTTFILSYLQDDSRRTNMSTRQLLERALAAYQEKLVGLERELPLLEERCDDEEWIQVTLDITRTLFWLNEEQGWQWFTPRFVESLVYSRALRDGLIEVVTQFEPLSRRSKQRLHRLKGIISQNVNEITEAITELERLKRMDWLAGDNERERQVILLFFQGLIAFRESDFSKALQIYQQAESILKQEWLWLKEILGDALRDIGWELGLKNGVAVPSPEALDAFERAIALLPDDGTIHIGLGVMHLGLKNYELAVNTINKGIELGAQGSGVFNWLGNVYRASGRNEEAITAYEKAIELDPKDAAPWNGLGTVYADSGRNEEAITAYQKAIELDPKYAYPWNGLGNVYRASGRQEEAITAYQKALELDPKGAYPWNGLGTVYRASGRQEEAITAYQKAIELDPKGAYPWNALGNVYRASGRQEEAITAYQKAIELDPKGAYPWNGLGNVYADSGRNEEAITAYEKAIELDPKYAAPWNGLGTVYADSGRQEEAITAYQKAIELDPKGAYPWNGLGNVYRASGRQEEAITAYQKAIELDPKGAYPWNELGIVYRASGRQEEAITAYEKAIELAPKYAYPWNGLGNVYADSGRNEEAITAYQKAIELAPSFSSPRNNLAGVYMKQHRFDEAIYHFQERIRLEPDTALNAYVSLGIINRHSGMPESTTCFQQALVVWDKVWQIRLQSVAGLLENKAVALLCLGQKEDAIQTLQEALTNRIPSDVIELDDYELLAQTPNPPDGLDEMITLLKFAIEKSPSDS